MKLEMTSLTIICPNAKRVQVKTSPMMILRQVLEEACLKSGFDVNCHQLQSQSRKIIDLSLPFRLSGIPNNATLEMTMKTEVQGDKAKVELAIQNPAGVRFQKTVLATTPLLEILRAFSPDFGEDLTSTIDSSAPCLIYMNRKYTGGAELSANSLSTMGILSGKCLIRFLRVKLSEEEIAKRAEEAEKKKALDAKFAKLKAGNEERERLEKKRLETFEKERNEREARERHQIDSILPTNDQPMDTSEFPAQRDILGDVPQQNPGTWSFDGSAFSRPAQQNTMRLEELNRLLERVDNSLSSANQISENGMNAMVDALADGGRISLGEVRARAEIAMEEEDQEEKEVFADPCDRQAVLFHKKTMRREEEPMEVSEEFFEVKVEDVKVMQRDLRKHVREQTQHGFVSKTFVAKKNRQLKMDAYKHSVIRVSIGDYILQSCYNSAEPSTRLDEFLKSVICVDKLRKNVKLFLTNQKVVTATDKNLVDIGIAPTATLVARFGGVEVDPTKMIENVRQVDASEADSISKRFLASNTAFQQYNPLVAEDRLQKRSTNHTGVSSTSPNGPPAKAAMPKWMTAGRK